LADCSFAYKYRGWPTYLLTTAEWGSWISLAVDNSTLAAITKWPNVPNCYGWLSLDRRGNFRIRNEFAQANQLPGDVINHAGLNHSIKTHYCIDEKNQYFYQNGPQRVYINLSYCPFIVRFIPSDNGAWILKNHLDQMIAPLRCFLDEKGNILLESNVTITQVVDKPAVSFSTITHRTIALLHDHDLGIFSSLSNMDVANCGVIGVFHWNNKDVPIEPIMAKDIPREFNFIPQPSNIST
jgi:hypothetical protein